MTTSLWDTYNCAANVRAILASAPQSDDGAMLMSAYQIAIDFAARFPVDFAGLNKPVGGLGSGQPNSLAQYLAGQLQARIARGDVTDIEIFYIDRRNLTKVVFNNAGSPVVASGPASGFSAVYFRLRAAPVT